MRPFKKKEDNLSDFTLAQIKRMMRVNIAGEKGACCLYAGQLWILSLKELWTKQDDHEMKEILWTLYEQETIHFQAFMAWNHNYRAKSTVFAPLWYPLGWAIGSMTGWNRDWAFLITQAIEKEVALHYEKQGEELDKLLGHDHPFTIFIKKCKEEEEEHHDKAQYFSEKKENTAFKRILSLTTHLATRWAIFLSKKA